MKAEMFEDEGAVCELLLTPETVEEAALLVRLRLNALRKPADISVYAWRGGKLQGCIVFALGTKQENEIAKGKP